MAAFIRYWLAPLLVLGTSGLGWAQGAIRFSNFDPDHGVDGRVLTWDGSLAGPEYVAQLLVSDLRLRHTYVWEDFNPVGQPTPFLLGDNGYATGIWRPTVLEVPGIAPWERVMVWVAVWPIDSGSTLEQAWRIGSHNVSNIFPLTLGDADEPAYLEDLQPIQILWEVRRPVTDCGRPFPLDARGRAPWPDHPRGDAWAVAISGDHAYVADQSGSLQVFEVSDLEQPRLVGGCRTRGPALGVAVSGRYAYLATATPGGLEIIDIADPAEPDPVGFVELGSYGLSVAVSGPYAYVANERAGLQIIDVSEPSRPVWVGGYQTPGFAHGVALSGPHALVADYHAGLAIVEVSDPANPLLVSSSATPGFARGVVVSGDHALVADDHQGLQVFRIADLANPTHVGGYDTPGHAYGLGLRGSHVYVADGDNGLVVVDVSEPANPRRAGAVGATGFARAVAVHGGQACVANGASGLQLIDIVDPANPQSVSEAALRGSVVSVAWSGRYAALADSQGGLRVVDVTDPAGPRLVGSVLTPGPALDAAWLGDHALVACGHGGLRVIDLTDPGEPRGRGAYQADGFYARQIVLADHHAYVVSDVSLAVFDVSNPAWPALVGTLPTVVDLFVSWPTRLAAANGYAYLTQGWEGLAVVDLTDPGNLRRVGHFDLWLQEAADVAVSGSHAYLITWHSWLESGDGAELHILDISDPTQPYWVGSCPAGAGIRLTVVGDYAYVSDAIDGIWVIDVSDPTDPRCLGISVAVSTPIQVAVAGNLIYVAGESEGLVVLERVAFFETLSIENGLLHVTWNAGPGSRLQTTSDLSAPRWEDWPGSEGTNVVTLPIDARGRFLRLVVP
jgi:hypothetical protein